MSFSPLIAVTPLFAADFRAIGLIVALVVLLGGLLLFVRNVFQARAELGSEIELAANKKEYFSDEELEGKKLDWSLSFALVILSILALSIPFYWLAEPGRQDGAVAAYQLNFESRGEGLYLNGAQCVNCHAAGGVGGAAAYVLQDQDGQFLANAQWSAPALNNLFHRYSEDEVTYILNFGRPGSPMAAWGTPGGGPLTTQQVQNVIEYVQTFQVPTIEPIAVNELDAAAGNNEASLAAADQAADIRAEVERSLAAGEFLTEGEAVFNLGYYSGYSGGALSCARCHTAGWALGPDAPHPGGDPLSVGVAGCGGGNPSGIGFSLCGGLHERFPDDTWKLPESMGGGWGPEGGTPFDNNNDGTADYNVYFADNGDAIRLDDKGAPITEDGQIYAILESGDLAACELTSNLWEPEGIAKDAYPYSATITNLQPDDSSDGFVDPPEQLQTGADDEIVFADGRLGTGCDIVEMPDRTSYAQYNFVYNGADAGSGYGRGGQSTAGMMPGFGALLPPDLLQAVIDYERGL